jgi:hypothetical protein
MNGRWLAGGLALVAIGATCGGDGGGFSSGIDKGANLGSLSEGDAQKLCSALGDWMKNEFAPKLKEGTCRLSAALAAGLGGSKDPAAQKAACKTAYDACLQKPASDEINTASCSKPPSTCQATVGEMESCINEIAPLMEQYFGKFPTCDQLGSGTVTLPSGQPQTPMSCTTFQNKCKGISLPGMGSDL